jgi:hypothetical protein
MVIFIFGQKIFMEEIGTLGIVKYIINHRKVLKMQNHFCWVPSTVLVLDMNLFYIDELLLSPYENIFIHS